MSKSPKTILRLSRRAAKSASATHVDPFVTSGWRRSLHLVSLSHQGSGSASPSPPWFDPSVPYSSNPSTGHSSNNGASSSSQQAKSGSSHSSHHALLPYSDLGPLGPGSEAFTLSVLQGSSIHGSSNLAFLPIYQAPKSPFSSSSGSGSDQDHVQERRAITTPQLCFGQNGAAGIPKTSQTLIPSIVGPASDLVAPASQEPELSIQVGEDAYFMRADALGVSDGVGGWSQHKGADSALFSRLLMHHCAGEFARYDDVDDPMFLEYEQADPVGVLHRASQQCLEDARNRGVAGSSTALICVLRNDILKVANLGDCNVSVIRGTKYLFRSDEQQHSFNHPFQIGSNSKDSPQKDAQKFEVKVQKGDIVILSSDGLIDNLYEIDILEEVLKFSHPSYDPLAADHDPFHPEAASYASTASSSSASPSSLDSDSSAEETASSMAADAVTGVAFNPQRLSEALCSRAKAVMMDPFVVASPFADRATDEGFYFSGGKKDDVTCIVGVVGEMEAAEDRR